MPEREPIEPSLSAQEREFERVLSRLPAAPPRFDDGQIWAIAAVRLEHRRVWFWRSVSGALAACLAVAVFARMPGTSISTTQPLSIHVATAPTTMAHVALPAPAVLAVWPVGADAYQPDGDETYMQVRQRVLQRGLDGVTPPPQWVGRGRTYSGPGVRIQAHDTIPTQPNTVNYLMSVLGRGSQL